jgi:hypothetical protein
VSNPWDDQLDLNHLERDLTAYAREIRELGYSDPDESTKKIHAAVGLLSEHLIRVIRREQEETNGRARYEHETAIPPVSA